MHDDFHLTVVGKGTTTLPLSYPYLWQGVAVSALGIAFLVVFSRSYRRSKEPADERP
ncbi:MAG: hypothetical protein LKJ49_08675 [Olsenella sp.]|nr:hypothetical protein [Olsenella sp.]